MAPLYIHRASDMSYPLPDEPNFMENLLKRKEFYSLKIDPSYNFRDPADAVNLGPLGDRYLKLHSHQLFVKNFMSPNTPFKRLHLLHGTGCHPAGTMVLRSNGREVCVERVCAGDMLMGDVGVRRVTALLSGTDDMYEIRLASGETFRCNHDHVLTLRFGADVLDIPLGVFIQMPDYVQKYAKMYRAHVTLPERDLSESPYTAGLACNFIDAVPDKFKYNCASVQFGYIRGLLIRARGQNSSDNATITGSLKFLTDCQYMCRCIGMSAQLRHGPRPELVISDEPTAESFQIRHQGREPYYGFTLDGNGRYLLSNFVVTHNSGKTLAAVSIANEFITVYKRMYASAATKIGIGRRYQVELDRATPSVFVLGFSGAKGAFMRELLDFPEFGFISLQEHDTMTKLRQTASSGMTDDINAAREFTNTIKRRIQNKSKDGFYKFFGYDEFVNRLFVTEKINLTDIETEVTARVKAGEAITLEAAIDDRIAAGDIQVNTALLAMFENSLLICDEIHNTYNKDVKNNRGVAIQYVLDKVSSVRFLSMSATPVNNSPTEVVELINYLNPVRTQKSDLFASARTLRPDALQKIGQLTYGRVSFLQKVDLRYYPKRTFMGEALRIPAPIAGFAAGDYVPYLKFVDCPMSAFHQATYVNHVMSEHPHLPEEYYVVPTDGYSIYDIAFPNPESETVGLFRSGDTRNKINGASGEWRDANGVAIKKYSAANNVIGGRFLRADNIGKYSTKFQTMMRLLSEIVASGAGDPNSVQKIMIYHNRVKMSGVLLVQEILRENGYLDESTEPTDNTICCVCGRMKSEHVADDELATPGSAIAVATQSSLQKVSADMATGSAITEHKFVPSRYVMVHSDIDKTTMEQSMAKYNAADNVHGLKYQILVGSKIMKESYNIKDTQNMIILSMPSDIPTFIQVIGRCVRTNSHVRLPPEQRRVNIHILISTVCTRFAYSSLVSPELHRYVDKLSVYKIIQLIEREINRTAIDADVHRDIIMSKELLQQYFPDGATTPVDTLGNLYFEPGYTLPPLRAEDLNLSTFTAYKHYESEIKTIVYIIKRMFMAASVYTYDELLAAVRRPPMSLEVNPGLFAEGNFVIALNHLVTPSVQIVTGEKIVSTESYFMERLFDQNEKFIYINRAKHQITQIDKYYILFPVVQAAAIPLGIREHEHIGGIRVSPERVQIDVETYLRPAAQSMGINIPIRDFVKQSKETLNYNVTRSQFIDKYMAADECTMFTMLTDYSADFQQAILQEIITTAATSSLGDLYAKIIKLYNKFKVLIYLGDIQRYKDVVKHYKNGLPQVAEDVPIGYISAKSVRLLDAGAWFEVSKISLNRHISYKENDVIIGYFENAPDHMKFKLRKPVQFIREDIRKDIMARQSKSEAEYSLSRTRSRAITGDTRLVERGIVCGTKNKHELLRIIANLGISVSKLDRQQVRIKKLCWLIRMRLIENEIYERQRDTKYKWLYSWFDQAPSLV